MKIKDKIVVVTGAATGIGRALAERFHREGAKHVAVVDLDGDRAKSVATAISGRAHVADVSREADILRVVKETETIGPIDLFCSNAGVADGDPDRANAASSPDAVWQRAWGVNVMAHIYAARAVLPSMIARRSGYFLNTISAAGLLSQIGSAVYSTTKHAAVGFAESLAITHRDQGIRVSMLCPQAVDTEMLRRGGRGAQNVDGILTPDQVAECVVEGIDREAFVILPHPQVATYMQRKTSDYDRWIAGMARFRNKLMDAQSR
jgi:NAD(P)-dependent dehydrogenase (short-subunit alcohol dehydrogenase family)